MTHTLPTWIARLLGIDAELGEGAAWGVEHAWYWPSWATLLFATAAIIIVVTIYLRESRQRSRRYRLMLATIRLFLVAIVLLMIAQLGISLKRTGLPYVALILDDSQSMTIVDRLDEKNQRRNAERVIEVLGSDSPDNAPSTETSTHEGVSEQPLEPSRWNLARTLLVERGGALLASIQKKHKLRLYFLDDSSSGVAAGTSNELDSLIVSLRSREEPTVATSRLGAGVRTVLNDLRGATPAAIVLMTDGINTEGPSLSDGVLAARRKGVPVYAVAIGSDQPTRDLWISDLLVDPLVFVDDAVFFEFSLASTGYGGKTVRAVLREKGKPQILSQTEVTLDADERPRRVRLPAYHPRKVGQFRYVVEVESLDGEFRVDNNQAERFVEVRKEEIRVLLVQGSPNFEFRYLRSMLQRDETIDLDTVLQDADIEHAEQDPSALRVFPVSQAELFKYDVVILGDANPDLLGRGALENLAEFVDQPGKGGALILIAGEQYMPTGYRNTPLERLMPGDLSTIRYPDPVASITDGFNVKLNELELANPAMQLGNTTEATREIWAQLPPLYWMVEMPDVKPGVRVLAHHPTLKAPRGQPLPVICLQYVGAGKVLMHTTDETWRWRRRVGDTHFGRYWVQMIRYLSRSKLVGQGNAITLSTDRHEYTLGESVRLRVRFADERLAPDAADGVTVMVQQRNAGTNRIPLRRGSAGRGSFEGNLEGAPVGEFHAWISEPTREGEPPATDFVVVAPPGEFERVRADTASLRHAAKQTRGRFYTFENAHLLAKHLPPGRPVPIETLPSKPLWNRWPVVLLFLGLLTIEWILRKRGGMV